MKPWGCTGDNTAPLPWGGVGRGSVWGEGEANRGSEEDKMEALSSVWICLQRSGETAGVEGPATFSKRFSIREILNSREEGRGGGKPSQQRARRIRRSTDGSRIGT